MLAAPTPQRPTSSKQLTMLLREAIRGDRTAYAHFLQHITPLLRRIVARSIIEADVEDVVQEILISVHKARHTFDESRAAMPWLASIARFRITDHLRKHYSQRRHMMHDIADYENLLADVTETHDSHESIQDMLINVPEKDKKILTMMHTEGFTAKEIGHRIGMKESAVKVAAHRAIKKLRKQTIGH